jgi:Cys-rich repeat protein
MGDADCDGWKCDTATGLCVECLADGDCAADYVCQSNVCKPEGGTPCQADSECDLGELCVGGKCVTGCRSNRDCPAGLVCDTARGANGQCVQCLTKEDCPGNYQCNDGQCSFVCSSDLDCPGRLCNTQTQQCVDCLSTDQCPIANICDEKGTCVPGCASARDCPDPLLCDPAEGEHGACVECLADGDCAGGNRACRNGACVTVCSSDNDCGGLKCDTGSGLCVQCLITDDCPLGNICDAEKSCVPGCASNRDCQPPLKCEPTIGANGTCVECLVDADCGAGSKCVSNACQIKCAGDGDCPYGHCEISTGKCVECLDDSHCAIGSVCVDGGCAPGCWDSNDCPPPMKCDTATTPGRCIACTVDADCQPDGTCQGGTCVYPGKQCGEACTSGGSECAKGLVCGLFSSTCVPVCTSNADCGGEQCWILRGTTGVCLSCPPPQCNPPCGANEECVQGQCVKKCFPPCEFGFACDNGACVPEDAGCAPPCNQGTFCWQQSCRTLETDGCPAGMIYLASRAVCVDRFEASLKDGELGGEDGTDTTARAACVAGVPPINYVTYHQAKKICANSGKRLCKAEEWQAACAGPQGNKYPYGNTYEAGACLVNSSATSPAPAGSYVRCISQVGSVDMSGNLWEWTDTQYSSASDRKIMGGGYVSTDLNSTCSSDLNYLDGQSSPVPLTEVRDTLGFRCCVTK